MYIIGTAGHVDHGKSTLVKSLTGIDPDRWAEEQRREMTIDLGFAWFTLPSGRLVSLVDVPGHERFIKNMLAGVGGFDAAMLVVAADEAVMPQTIEHLAILDLLEVRHGLVVLTKADLVDAPWLDLVREEVSERLRGTSLAHAPLVAVSARSGAGLNELRQTLDAVLDATPARSHARGHPRLPVDRAFTMGGFGTVVTGTLLDGPLALGAELEILPVGRKARVRGLQIHGQKTEVALPGNRVAVNLAGIHHSEVGRGAVLAPPGALRPTHMLDLHLRVLADAPAPILQNSALDLFSGASEVPCRVTLLDAEQLDPGAQGWVQLRLAAPIALRRGDRCILRVASPSRTVAGGLVVDTHPARHRRFRADVLAQLETLARGEPADLLLQALACGMPQTYAEAATRSGLPEAELGPLAAQGVAAGQIVLLNSQSNDPHMISTGAWEQLCTQLQEHLRAHHQRFPLRRGIPREELRQKLQLNPRSLSAVLHQAAQQALIATNETSVWLQGHNPHPDAAGQHALAAALEAMARSPYSPPAPKLDGELLAWALEQHLFVRVAPEVFFLPATYAELVAWVRQTIINQGSISLGNIRDHFGSSRKYALALLEHLDERKITRREGEARVLV
ncbi:selenocysteine-specific translation elongation factor [Candidatus Viridilinea mediisalina]|uniref:Selenocysteine-specific elongation factor n=1 Tax=Candidatus Viridilinea mediisalina TaxID=2024553 RepID=A0A2A6RD54_9CHLR|nr:selenocysteine-specific translation elongation factor [Candidatus Viridilinea mediisalina]PDV98896.1 selenocysteine-specific translation elongation factor [Candidatus Viridilinea mediisalina]